MEHPHYRVPAFRKLRAYAFDPSLSLDFETADINELVYNIPWEKLGPGPIGEYLEIIDYDPTIKQFYQPVNLDHPYILAEQGLAPSESNPQYHQQMVYAVAMTTIKNFEQALGRKIIWSTRLLKDRGEYEVYIDRLRIYPHGLRAANAYYSPLKKALLFGYFEASPANAALHKPGALVFTCLSHDIIAHEVTHAILDGLNRNYRNPTNPDVLAFHEAFADLIALFQHFTFPEVLKHQIAQTRGNLEEQNLLGQLAQELGTAIGGYGSLRDAIGSIDPQTSKWTKNKPSPDDYSRYLEPHRRGSILVASVFDAFLTIYKNRVEDLLRIATNGTGVLPEGELHPDLVNRMTYEASKSAKHILLMCIRALDYCPPVDITFGDFLRAIITADIDLVKADRKNYRLAFVEAFQKRGIYPDGIKTLSIDSLQHKLLNIVIGEQEDLYVVRSLRNVKKEKFYTNSNIVEREKLDVDKPTEELLRTILKFFRAYAEEIKYENDREKIYEITKKYITGAYAESKSGLHTQLKNLLDSTYFVELSGLPFTSYFKAIGVRSSSKSADIPSFSIQNLRLINRVGPEGNQINQVIFSIVQKSGIRFRNGKPIGHFVPESVHEDSKGEFVFEGGCTLIFDIDTFALRYAITKPVLDLEHLERAKSEKVNYKNRISKEMLRINTKRAEEHYHFMFEDASVHASAYQQYFGTGPNDYLYNEPFGFLHRHAGDNEEF